MRLALPLPQCDRRSISATHTHSRRCTKRDGQRGRCLSCTNGYSACRATAAVANPIPIGDGGAVPIAPVRAATVQVIGTGGMAGWQITLIAAGAALAAATAAVFADRKLAGRRSVTATTA
jgi:hypothetical protein